MPSYWYDKRVAKKMAEEDESEENKINERIVAYRKPYFMTYVYPDLKKKNRDYNLKCRYGSILKWSNKNIKSVDDLYASNRKTKRMKDSIKTHDYIVGYNGCTVNKISKLFEDEFYRVNTKGFSNKEFDHTILKSNVEYSRKTYDSILEVYRDYKNKVRKFKTDSQTQRYDEYEIAYQKKLFVDMFKARCEIICSNENELCDILVDMCYTSESMKQFAWEICGYVMINNLLKNNNYEVSFPVLSCRDDSEFVYCGDNYKMGKKIIEVDS